VSRASASPTRQPSMTNLPRLPGDYWRSRRTCTRDDPGWGGSNRGTGTSRRRQSGEPRRSTPALAARNSGLSSSARVHSGRQHNMDTSAPAWLACSSTSRSGFRQHVPASIASASRVSVFYSIDHAVASEGCYNGRPYLLISC
jgi:hypothetical protein